VVTNTGKVLYAATTNQNHRVLLKVVSFSGDVTSYLHAVRETHTANLTKSGVWLFRGSGVNARAHTTFLGAGTKGGGGSFYLHRFTTLPDELLNRRHFFLTG
jgi:hypothetical protein